MGPTQHPDGSIPDARTEASEDPLLDELERKRLHGRWWEYPLDGSGVRRPAAALVQLAPGVASLALAIIVGALVNHETGDDPASSPPDDRWASIGAAAFLAGVLAGALVRLHRRLSDRRAWTTGDAGEHGHGR